MEPDTRRLIASALGQDQRTGAVAAEGERDVRVVEHQAEAQGARASAQLERLPDVIKVGRPAFGQENGKVTLFKLDGNGEAHRVHVVLGRSSVNEIEIVEGLQPGDQVILSDMSAQDAYDRIRLNQ